MLGQEVLLKLADWPFHACVLIIFIILLLNGHICEVHVQILHVSLVCSVPGGREPAEATPA